MGRLRWIAALVLLALTLAGCTLNGDDASDAGGEAGRAADGSAQDAAAEDAAVDEGGGEDAAATDREVVTTGSMTLLTEDAVDAAEAAVALVEDAGGRVDERSQQAANGSDAARAWLTVRVPADRLTPVLEALRGLGEVEDLTITAEDVTRQTQDLDARITALETSVERLLGLMADAETSEALIAAEEALSSRQAQLESLQSQRAYLADQVALSTLRLELVTETDAQLEPGGFLGGVAQGWDGLLTALSGLLVVLGVLLPWLVVLGVPAVVVLWLLRRRRRRSPSGA